MIRPKIDIEEHEKQTIIRMYVSEKLSIRSIYEKRYSGFMCERTFWNYVKRNIPELTKMKSLRISKETARHLFPAKE